MGSDNHVLININEFNRNIDLIQSHAVRADECSTSIETSSKSQEVSREQEFSSIRTLQDWDIPLPKVNFDNFIFPLRLKAYFKRLTHKTTEIGCLVEIIEIDR